MERVAFLIERTGERISCMLNPETLITRRTAGVQKRNGALGPLQAMRQTDDPILYTGGGTTEMILDLLFDTTLAPDSAQEAGDVRALTRPLWNLAENASSDSNQGEAPVIRFVWGKTWNVPGLVTGVAERLDFFSDSGVPRRSWLRMRFCRVHLAGQTSQPSPSAPDIDDLWLPDVLEDGSSRDAIEVTGGPQLRQDGDVVPSRLDEIAYRNYGRADLWRTLAWFNRVADPLRVTAGTLLRLPDLASLRKSTAPLKESA